MVSEHRRLKFHDDLLASTFSISSAGNGISAISAGFLAQLAAGRLIIEFSSSILHFTVRTFPSLSQIDTAILDLFNLPSL